jgi:hypothetical protein
LPLGRGDTLSHYRLVDVLGEGGMGVVWRALDSTLGREVALKVLPDRLAQDPDRLARFEREARLLAALNHPNIAAIYGFEQSGSTRILVMELVEGVTLAQRLAQGPIPLIESLRICKQIAEALEYAHERGIVHRDLKPANVKLRPDDAVKVLDFGLAKALEGDGPAAQLANSPTLSLAATQAGIVLGTAAYMSPEQAKGRPADRRVDIWAFGCVLWEALTGRQLHGGDTMSEVVASVLRDAPDLTSLPRDAPTRVRELLRRCLTKDAPLRLRDIGEARIALDELLAGTPDPYLSAALAIGEVAPPVGGTGSAMGGVLGGAGGAGAGLAGGVGAGLAGGVGFGLAGGGFAGRDQAAPRSKRAILLVAAAGLALGALLTFAATRTQSPAARGTTAVRKLAVPVRGDAEDAPILPTLSPDGRAVAYVRGGRIAIQELNALEPREYAADPGVIDLFWSPDNRSVAYIAGTKITKLDIGTGAAQIICDVRGAGFTGGSGGSWREDGTIIASRGEHDGILAVSARGGDAHTIVPVDSTLESDLHEPVALPGGATVVFVPHSIHKPFQSLVAWSANHRKVLLSMEDQRLATPVYSPTGHILFQRSPTNSGIWAVPYSLTRAEVTGEPFLVAPGGSQPSVASDGTLAYLHGAATDHIHVVWSDRSGSQGADLGEINNPARFDWMAASPDGNLVAVTVGDMEGADLWIFDTKRGTRTRLTFLDGIGIWPSFSPAGDRIVFQFVAKQCQQVKCHRVIVMSVDGTGVPDTLGVGLTPSFTPDGRSVVYARVKADDDWDLACFSLQDRSERPLVTGPSIQSDPRVSPDGRYVAYTSSESGHDEIYLKRFPSGEGRWQVSAGGGTYPRWNARGDRLCYANGVDLFEIEVQLGASPQFGKAVKLFTRPDIGRSTPAGWPSGFDVTRDGQRFVFYRPAGSVDRRASIIVVQNWFEEFRERK